MDRKYTLHDLNAFKLMRLVLRPEIQSKIFVNVPCTFDNNLFSAFVGYSVAIMANCLNVFFQICYIFTEFLSTCSISC